MHPSDSLQRRLWLASLILGIPALVLLAFGHALFQDWAPIDDILLITGNIAAHGLSWEHIRLAFTTFDPELYIPLTLLSFQIDYSLAGGLVPHLFHATNLLLQMTNAALVALLLQKLTGSRWGSLLGAFLFAVLPLHTEAVVWVTGRKDLLFAFFALLSLLFWTDRERGKRYIVAAVGCLLLALLAKVTAVIVVPLMVLIDWYVEREQRVQMKQKGQGSDEISSGKRLSPLKPLSHLYPYLGSLVLCLVFGVVAFGGKERVLGSQPVFELVFTGFRSIWYYVKNFFVPTELAISHEWIGPFTLANAELIAGAIVTVAVTAAAWRLRDRTRWLAFGWAWFLLSLAPTFLGSRKGGTLLYAVDRYGYVPSIGLIFLMVMTGIVIAKRWNAGKIVASAAALVILIAIPLSRRQTHTWDTPESLFEQSLAITPESVGSRVSLADVMLQANDIQGSFAVLREGLKYGEHRLLSLSAASVYARAGDTASAREQFAKVLNDNPQDPDALFGIASLDEQQGSPDAALAGYQKAVTADPSFVSARNGIARILIARGDEPGAEEQLREALHWNPSSAESHSILGHLLEKRGEMTAAEAHYRIVLDVRGESADVLLALARVLIAQDKRDEARTHIQRVLQAEPGNTEAKEMLNF